MAKQRDAFQTVTVKPMSGGLDTRSLPSDVALGVWRWKQNMRLRDGMKLCCREGFEKAFSNQSPYVNADFHDQGNLATQHPVKEMITLIFESLLNNGDRILYVGTQSGLFLLDEDNGIWTQITIGKGGATQPGLAQTRFKAAELQEIIVFVNNVDHVLWTVVGTNSVSDVGELLGLGVTTAGVVVEFNGVMMVMDVVEDGVRQSSRIWWSDFNLPTNFNPGSPDSISNYQDLDYGSQILAAVPMAGALYIFTTSAIWRCTPTGDSSSVFQFTRVYNEPQNQAKCLVYPNTLVSNGTSVWYAGREAIYYYDPFQPEPVREEWLFRGGAVMYSDLSALDPTCCQSPVACLMPDHKEIYVSWPEVSTNGEGGCVNTKTLIFSPDYKSPDIYDHGFSALANYRPSDPDTAGCKGATQLFLGASTTDLCLKNIGVNFSREMLSNTDGQGSVVNGVYVPFTGIYVATGYYRILRMLFPLVNYDREKKIRSLLVEVHPEVQATPCVLKCRVGNSFSESDPNSPNGRCSVLWHDLLDKQLKCLDTMTAAQYVAANVRRNSGLQWLFLYSGRFTYVELKVANADGSAAIGSDCSFSRMELQVQLQPMPAP